MSRRPWALVSIAALLGGAAALAPPAATPASAAPEDVVINEIITNDPVLADSIELYNTGSEPVDLSAWIIKDDNDSRTDALAAGTVIEPGQYLVLTNGVEFTFGLGNGDSARLFLPDGTTMIDGHAFPAHSAPSWSRCPDGTGDFLQAASVTLGAANDCDVEAVGADNLVLNEVDSGPLDWIELYNSGSQPLDISGYAITDNAPSDATHRYVFPEGTVIPAGSYFVVDGNTFQFGLGGADSVLVFAPGTSFDPSEAIQTASWTEHAAIGGDEALAANSRCPDVTGEPWSVAIATPGAFNDCPSAIRINEVESDGDATDWVEIVNASAEPVDISGWTVMDNDPAGHAADVTPVPAGTVLAPGAYYVFDQNTHFTFGLGRADVASIRDTGGAVVAQYTWTDHAAVTYGRCPDTSGPFVDQPYSSKGAANNCDGTVPVDPDPETPIDTIPWPGGPEVTVEDPVQRFLEDSSGLEFQATADGTFLWGVDNNAATVFKMIANADGSVSLAPGWENGRAMRFLTDAGPAGPDAEGITMAGDGYLYLAVERDNNDKGTNYNVILQVDPNAAGDTVTASRQWDITGTLPAVSANTGIEAVEWISDADLAGRLWDTTLGKPYDPADYPGHGTGLFFTALENNGHLYAFALNADGTHALVAEILPYLGGVMALDWDSELGLLWAVCDNGCAGTAAQVTFNGTDAPGVVHVTRPAGMPDLNSEGFATATDALCTDGVRPVWWFADGEVPAALRSGTLPCAVDVPAPSPSPSETSTVTPTVTPTDGASTVAPTNAASASPSSRAPLAATGAEVLPMLGVAVLAFALGGGLLVARRHI